MIMLESLPGSPMVPFEVVYPLLGNSARLEIELIATRLVASQALTERAELESHVEILTSQTDGSDPDSKLNTAFNLKDPANDSGNETGN